MITELKLQFIKLKIFLAKITIKITNLLEFNL